MLHCILYLVKQTLTRQAASHDVYCRMVNTEM